MNIKKARDFILETARPLEKAVYQYHFEGGSKEAVLVELQKYQNEDGGFGNALESDSWNPNSSPITTNDAIMTLYAIDAFGNAEAKGMMDGIVRYLKSHDCFDEERGQWQFAIETNRDYPHAIWWEKNGDGIEECNPTVSLAAFMVCFGEDRAFYERLVKQSFEYLSKNAMDGGALKCFLVCYKMLQKQGIVDVIDYVKAKELITRRIAEKICRDESKYGVEYVPAPSDFFSAATAEFIDESVREFVDVELNVIDKLQKEDGGFDITWQWYTTFDEQFEQARAWWRPRVTTEKMLFVRDFS